VHTVELLSSDWKGTSSGDSGFDFTIHWISMGVDFQTFDAYIQENYLDPYEVSVKKL
jgi:hypothetical protein